MASVKTIICERLVSDEVLRGMVGDYIPPSILDQTLVLKSDADVYGLDGHLLAKFRKSVIPPHLCKLGLECFEKAAQVSYNRGAAAGPIDMAKLPPEAVALRPRREHEKGVPGKNYTYYIRPDGSDAKNCVSNAVYSGVIGYYEKARQLPCRLTAFTRKHFDRYTVGLPFIQYLSDLFKELVPERYECQKERALQSPDYIIPGTVFSTFSANKNFRTAIHKDKGDYEEGFGTLACLGKGYEGAYTIFPAYGVGFDVREGDFLAMDVHEYHGNSELTPTQEDYIRLGFVCFLRKRIKFCA
jgi:hypothetical protein